MLRRTRMKRALFVVLGVTIGLMALSPAASAGGYVGLAVGTVPTINDDFVTATAVPSGRSLRLLGGFRFANNLSIEAALDGFGVITEHFGDQTVYQLALAAKYSLPLGDNFEAFGRAGLEHTWLGRDNDQYDLSGNGLMLGLGFEYRLDAVLKNASVFVDFTLHHVSLQDQRAPQSPLDLTSRMWGLGFALGF